MQLNWNKCQGNVWCKLNAVNLDHEHFNNMHGVYVIWHGGTNPEVVYVGQGNIRECLTEHRNDPQIQRYDHLDLYVTWAAAPKEHRDAMELYLANTWSPKIVERNPQTFPAMTVNSPWP